MKLATSSYYYKPVGINPLAAAANIDLLYRMENFFKTLKYEEVNLCEYETIVDVRTGVSRFIEKVYNQKRLHSARGLRPPNEYEEILRGENREEHRRELLTLCV